MDAPATPQVQLLRALARHEVEFVVIGGVAAQIHGWQNATLDLDIAVSTEDANVERLNKALASVDAGEPAVGAIGTTFKTRYGRLEVVRVAHGVGRYEDWLAAAVKHEIEGVTIAVAAPSDILHSKEAAGREKDIAALPAMRQDFKRSGAL